MQYCRLMSFFIGFVLFANTAHALESVDLSLVSESSQPAQENQSIKHFRAFYPPLLNENIKSTFVSRISQDQLGYLWLTGDRETVYRYDGYELKRFVTSGAQQENENEAVTMRMDNDGRLWFANSRLHLLSESSDSFESFNVTDGRFIHDIIDDGNGNLWLFGRKFGFVKFNKALKAVVGEFANETIANLPDVFFSAQIDKGENLLWMVSNLGLHKYDIINKTLKTVNTPIDDILQASYTRNIALDVRNNKLWLPTIRGILKVDASTSVATLIDQESHPELPSNYATTVFIDAKNKKWFGFEKEGICLYQSALDRFSCLGSSDTAENAVPSSTVENIFESADGSLWLAMNNSGFVRVTPNLEKFSSLQQRTANDINYKRTIMGLHLDNGEIWLATDGEGIQIIHSRSGETQELRHNSENPDSLPSDAVITLALGPEGYVWAGTWEGGLSKIDPVSKDITNISLSEIEDEKEKQALRSVVELSFDDSGKLWLARWYEGLQSYDPKTGKFETFPAVPELSNLIQKVVHDIKYHDGFLYLLGSRGLERFSTSDFSSEIIFSPSSCPCEGIFVGENNTLYVGANKGFYSFNTKSNESRFFALNDDELLQTYYFTNDSSGALWVGTNMGIFRYNFEANSYQQYTMLDGLTSSTFTRFGETFNVGKEIHFPSRNGVSIVNPYNLPVRENTSTSLITGLNVLDKNNTDLSKLLFEARDKKNNERTEIPYNMNNLAFSFSTVNLVFPDKNKYKYRLLGLNDQFQEVDSEQRVARFTNLRPKRYTFEVYAANSHGIWDANGASFSFVVSAPWYQTWWATLAFTLILLTIIIAFLKWRVRFLKERQKQMTIIIQEKTSQITQYAEELEKASAELEQRVEERTHSLKVEINERKVVESKLYHLAFHDALTELPNREWLNKKLSRLVKSIPRKPFGVMFLDGDRFKLINDTLGHAAGDEILIESSRKISALLTESQHAVRLGGDEFTVLCENVESVDELSDLAAKIVEAFEEPFYIRDAKVWLNMSVGVVLCDESYHNTSMPLQDADIAMYEAKNAGKCTYKIFDLAMREKASDLTKLEAELRNAIQNKELSLAYQPIVDAQTQDLVSFEALLRWQHPDKGNIPPDKFIPVAEDTGLIIPIGNWVIGEACKTLSAWQRLPNMRNLAMSVNLSSVQLKDSELLSYLGATVAQHDITPLTLKLELTETSMIDCHETVNDMLDNIVEMGIDLAIDDFGTGYSSLSYLTQLPAKYLKIDRKFVDALDNKSELSRRGEAYEIVKAAITLSHSLKMQVVAEGIETSGQLAILQELSCDFLQGYFISRPLFPKAAEDFLCSPED